MTDNKFTDTDIAKALKCCANKKQCSDCPFCVTSREPCYITLAREAASLLDRREAEIDRLKKGWRADVVETANAKAEAIKEFAERLKIDFGHGVLGMNSVAAIIDNLVKEMTEGQT